MGFRGPGSAGLPILRANNSRGETGVARLQNGWILQLLAPIEHVLPLSRQPGSPHLSARATACTSSFLCPAAPGRRFQPPFSALSPEFNGT